MDELGIEVGYLHHVGHVVRNMEQALELYRRFGFTCDAPAYPTLSRTVGEPPRPFGAANTHATFERNFVEIVTVVTDASQVPKGAKFVPLQVPPAALPRIFDAIERTVGKLSASLARFEGIHVLAFQTDDADKSVSRFNTTGVGHSGVNTVQRPIETSVGQQMVMTRVVEIDREDVPEGRLAVAENPDAETLRSQVNLEHPIGAVDLVESILCVPDSEVDAYVARYQRYTGRVAAQRDAASIFDLRDSRVTLVPARALDAMLPGEAPPSLPAFVGYAVAVRNLGFARRLLQSNGFPVRQTPAGDIFVPAHAALGAAVVFRQAGA